ncbi:MAG: hypothetical protein LV479_01660 [Methylacidiphilales bacterium]|nr:hypothetical protein [Candidatus Methylacidiphilales bacterium]
MSETQIMALRESETRLIIEDRALQTLENERKHRRISRQEFAYREHDLTAMISEEAQFQNVILIKEPGLPVDAGELLQTIGKYAIEVPVYALAIVARGLAGSSFSFSP